MKKKILIILMIISLLFLSGCTVKLKSNNSDATISPATTGSVLVSNNGVDVKSVAVVLVGSTYNFQVVFSNSTSEDRDFDMSKFDVKSGSTSLTIGGSKTKTIEANKTYAQWTFTMSDTSNLKVGDSVKVYYDGKLIDTVTVEEF